MREAHKHKAVGSARPTLLGEGGERGGDQPFDRQAVGLCETIAALIGPALELKRQHDRSLPFKIWESSRRQIGKVIGAGHVGLKLILLLATACCRDGLTAHRASAVRRRCRPARSRRALQR